MPLLVVAGEASGDLHGAEILRELKRLYPDLRVVGIGGEAMSPFLDRKLADVADLSVMGYVEVVKHLPSLWRLKRQILSVAAEEGCGVALFIDYPGFNLSLAKSLRKALPSMRLHHFVCPQVWAWKKGRIPVLGRTLDALYCLFPFEPPLFQGHPVEALCLGNPLVDKVAPELDRAAFFAHAGLREGTPLVALLPGSRPGEIARLLPALAEAVRLWIADPSRPTLQWVLPVAPGLDPAWIRGFLGDLPVTLVQGCSYAARAYADAALVCSGTATLETALLGTPFVLFYRMSPLTYRLAQLLVKLPDFGLVNIVAGRRIVPELLQDEVTGPRLVAELERLLDPGVAESMRAELAECRGRLGAPGAAARVAAHLAEAFRAR